MKVTFLVPFLSKKSPGLPNVLSLLFISSTWPSLPIFTKSLYMTFSLVVLWFLYSVASNYSFGNLNIVTTLEYNYANWAYTVHSGRQSCYWLCSTSLIFLNSYSIWSYSFSSYYFQRSFGLVILSKLVAFISVLVV